MPKSPNQKLKLLYLLKILREETDDRHGLTAPEILDRLAGFDVPAERKTLYQDLEELRVFGFDVVGSRTGRETRYALVSREFELPELKLLVDSVQGAKFITERKSRELIRKLESLVSRYEARHLQRQVVISGRVKSMNESVYYNVDAIHEAIGADRAITFKYFNWTPEKKTALRKDGALYRVSPWGLLWDSDYYYMVGYDAEDGLIKHYRVDKMLNIGVTEVPREGRDAFKKFDLPRYANRLFGMYGGTEADISFEGSEEMAGVLIDRFGKEIPMHPAGPGRFTAHVTVAVSPQFLGWVFGLGDGIRVTGPDWVVTAIRGRAEEFLKTYL